MRKFFCVKELNLAVLLCVSISLTSQELYVYTEPASNMPSRSISTKLTSRFQEGFQSRAFEQRYVPEIMVGLNKNWMVHAVASFSDMYTGRLRWEAAWLYAKYRFLSLDEVHRHFRMAAFAEYAYSRNPVLYEELSLQGDHSGVQAGIIATQLLNKLAVSGTASILKVTSPKPKVFPEGYPYSSVNYTLSAGYLLLPVEYTDFNQTNLNLYVEFLGQRTLDKSRYFADLAPAVQLIFNSNTKLNLGYRFQLTSNMHRMSEESWLISVERTFLNALNKNK